jgi:hypothetical protein
MSAQDNLSPQQFFHGTTHEFAPGDVVLPATRLGEEFRPVGVGRVKHAYASSAPEFARQHAERRAQSGGNPRVYQVEPVDKDEATPWGGGSFYRSQAGFRVLKEVE